jgi:hypothetical protein
MSASADERAKLARLTRTWVELCDCGGPQPSLDNPKADEHAGDCKYREAVEKGGDEP